MKALLVILLLTISHSGLACRRTAINASTKMMADVVKHLRGLKGLDKYSIEKIEVEDTKFIVSLEREDEKCRVTLAVSADTACRTIIEPIGKVACP